MKTETDNSVQDQNATCDNNMLGDVFRLGTKIVLKNIGIGHFINYIEGDCPEPRCKIYLEKRLNKNSIEWLGERFEFVKDISLNIA